jgi:hypothetical protein
MTAPRPLDWRARPAGSDKALILFKVIACFALLGPPLGALTFFGLLGLSLGQEFLDGFGVLGAFSIFGLPLFYFVGGMPAALIGALVGFWQAFRGPVSWTGAAALGLACGAAIAGSGRWVVEGLGHADLALVLLTCLIPTLICWYVTRNAAIRPPPESP